MSSAPTMQPPAGARLQSVEWLAATTALSLAQAYEAIRVGQIPTECVIKIGRRVRVIECKVCGWLGIPLEPSLG